MLKKIRIGLNWARRNRAGLRRAVPQEKMIRAHVRVKGQVQGVYYRAHACQKAFRTGVTGWIRNLTDGTVEAVLEGNEPAVKGFLDWFHRGSPRSVVEQVDVTWEPYVGEFNRFSARGTPDG